MNALSSIRMDKRPFKGKGAEEWLARINRDYRKTLEEMAHLSGQTKRSSGHAWYVYLHHRKSTGQRFLMWRSFGVTHVHLAWDSIQPMLGRMAQSQREWFEEVNEEMRLLNAKEMATRKALKIAQELVRGG